MIRRLLVLPVVLLMAACGGATEPTPPPLALTLSSDMTVTGTRTAQPDGSTLILCPFQITATVTGGRAGDAVIWDGGQDVNYDATGAELNIVPFAQTDLVNWFGSDRIVTGSSVTARLHMQWTAPFSSVQTYRYHLPTGEERAATWRLTCQ